MTTNDVLIKVNNLQKAFGEIEVLKGVTTDVKKGEVVVIEEAFGIRVTEVVK